MKSRISLVLFFSLFVFSCLSLNAEDWKVFYEKEKAAKLAAQRNDWETAAKLSIEIINLEVEENSETYDSNIRYKGNAYFRLGHYCLHGHYFKYDLQKAIHYFEKASEFKSEHGQAELYLAMIFNLDKYGVQDYDKSFYWICEGAKKCATIRFLLGEIYEYGKTSFLINSSSAINVKKRGNPELIFPYIKNDYQKACDYYYQYFQSNSCYIEDVDSCYYKVAIALMDGVIGERNYSEARGYLLSFINKFNDKVQDNSIRTKLGDAYWRLSTLYRFGLGTVPLEMKADYFLKSAAELGNSNAIKAIESMSINN